MKTLLLKFSGPLQSRGTDSHFETRHTDLWPSKSGVIGLLAACLGLRRDEDEKIASLNSLDFAVREDQRGRLMKDYQIARAYDKKGEFARTYVTNRYYLEDFVFVVALGSEDDDLIEELATAVKFPYFQPYLGKRSLPLTSDFFLDIREKGPIESLKDLDRQAADFYKKKHMDKEYLDLNLYCDSDLLEESPEKYMRRDRVISFSQRERKFGIRREARGRIRVKNPSFEKRESHDFFNYLEGDHVSDED